MFPLLRSQAGVFSRPAWPQLLFRPVVKVVVLVAQLATWHALHAVPCATRSPTHAHHISVASH